MRAIRDILKSAGRLFCSWFHIDRIRMSPTEGRLLSLQPGQRILLRQQVYAVCGPAAADPVDRQLLTIRLESDEGSASLDVQRASDGRFRSARLLDECGRFTDIFDDDVDLLPHQHHVATDRRLTQLSCDS